MKRTDKIFLYMGLIAIAVSMLIPFLWMLSTSLMDELEVYQFPPKFIPSVYTGILAYNDQFKLNGSYVIPAAMFGENDDFDEATAHVPGALIARFVRAVKTNLPEVEIWGDGSQVRDFMDVKESLPCILER